MSGLVDTFLSGSFARKTHAQRIKDVDFIAVLEDPDGRFRSSASYTLNEVKKVVEKYSGVRSAEARVRTVQLTLTDHEFTFDVVPALEPNNGDDGLLLCRNMPEEGHDDWSLANPKGQTEAARQKNRDTDGLFVPAARVVKFWNRRQGDPKPFRSYHAEAILWHSMSEPTSYADAILHFFEFALESLDHHVTDPGDPANNVDDRVTPAERGFARARVTEAVRIARLAVAESDDLQAAEYWTDIFGPAFPAPSTSRESVAEALKDGAAAGFATGVRAGSGVALIQSRPWRPS